MAGDELDGQDEAMAALDALGPSEAEPEVDAPPAKAKKRVRDYAAEDARRGRPRSQRGGTKEKAAPKAPRPASPRRPNIATGMQQLYAMAGLGVSVLPSGVAVAGPGAGKTSITAVTGQAMVANSRALGVAWEAAAKDDPRIREAIEKLLTVSTLGQIAAAHLPIVMTGMCAAGAVPEDTLVKLGMMEAPTGEPAEVIDFPTTGDGAP